MCKLFLQTLTSLMLIGFYGQLFASELLPRSAFLGLLPESTEVNQPVVIQGLHPMGTGSALGLKEGDIISTVNQKSIADFATLISVLREIRAGNQLVVEVKRDKSEITLSAFTVDRPQEAGEGYQVIYDAFPWEKEKIRTITYTPDKPRTDGASVFFIQGYTCGSIDYGMIPEVSISQLLGNFAQAGFTVMKMEKPGVGDSTGELDCSQYDFITENTAFTAGLAHFKKQRGMNENNIFVFGHSLGVLHAALLAEQGRVKGVIGYGGVLKSWYDYLQDIFSQQSVKYWGVNSKQAKENLAKVMPFLTQWLTTQKTWQEVIDGKAGKSAQKSGLLPLDGEQVFQRHYSFFRNLNTIDFMDTWRNAKADVLMLHGGFDIQAIDGHWAEEIQEIVNDNTSLSGKSVYFERTDHNLMQYKNKSDLMKVTRRQAKDLGRFNKDISSTSIDWMNSILTIKNAKKD